MLLIRKKQIDALEESEIAKFETRMRQHLRTAFPDQTVALEDDALTALICHGMGKAKHHGIDMEWDVRRVIECCLLLGPAFGEDAETAAAGDILRDDTLDGREKMDKIEQMDSNWARM